MKPGPGRKFQPRVANHCRDNPDCSLAMWYRTRSVTQKRSISHRHNHNHNHALGCVYLQPLAAKLVRRPMDKALAVDSYIAEWIARTGLWSGCRRIHPMISLGVDQAPSGFDCATSRMHLHIRVTETECKVCSVLSTEYANTRCAYVRARLSEKALLQFYNSRS